VSKKSLFCKNTTDNNSCLTVPDTSPRLLHML
jgi:hypothetical protein